MQQVIKYFNGELLQCSIGIGISLVSIGASLFFLVKAKMNFYKGMAYPFFIISLVLMATCIGVVLRTPQDVRRVQDFVQHDTMKITTLEIPRMNTVMRNFKIIKIIEACLFVIGLCLFIFLPGGTFWKGIAMGLLIQAAIMLTFDIIAESRGQTYREHLHTITHEVPDKF